MDGRTVEVRQDLQRDSLQRFLIRWLGGVSLTGTKDSCDRKWLEAALGLYSLERGRPPAALRCICRDTRQTRRLRLSCGGGGAVEKQDFDSVPFSSLCNSGSRAVKAVMSKTLILQLFRDSF